jgi:hypothetical protein
MLFLPSDLTDEAWSLIARATATISLGIGAKVGPHDKEKDPHSREPRLICVYTKDFADKEDVARVLRELIALKVVSSRAKPIFYKPGKYNSTQVRLAKNWSLRADAYTYLNIMSGNRWGIKPTLYNSADVLKETKDKS